MVPVERLATGAMLKRGLDLHTQVDADGTLVNLFSHDVEIVSYAIEVVVGWKRRCRR